MKTYIYAIVDSVQVMWSVWQTGVDKARIDFSQQDSNGDWKTSYGNEERLHGGTPEGYLEETVSFQLLDWHEQGLNVRRLK